MHFEKHSSCVADFNMHAAAVQMQTTTVPRACQAPWLSNKRLCLRSGPSKPKATSVFCTSSLQHDNTNPAQRRPSQISAATDTLVNTVAEDVHTNEAPGKNPQSDPDRQHFDWHNQWYAVGYERWVLSAMLLHSYLCLGQPFYSLRLQELKEGTVTCTSVLAGTLMKPNQMLSRCLASRCELRL